MPEDASQLAITSDVDGAMVLDGEIDAHSATLLASELRDNPGITVLDVSEVTFIDSSGLRVLVEAHQEREGSGGLLLRSPSAAVQRLLEISGLTGHLDVSG